MKKKMIIGFLVFVGLWIGFMAILMKKETGKNQQNTMYITENEDCTVVTTGPIQDGDCVVTSGVIYFK